MQVKFQKGIYNIAENEQICSLDKTRFSFCEDSIRLKCKIIVLSTGDDAFQPHRIMWHKKALESQKTKLMG